jgi:parallel beta-helix repeat protein
MKKGVVAVGLLLMVLGVMGLTEATPGLKAHEPIIILGDQGFTPESGVTGGSGMAEDPYIIEGWEIDAQGRFGIYIERTQKHFIIRNCRIYGAGSRPWAAVRFQEVSNGTIEGCGISSNMGHGIWISDSSNIEISGNSILNNNEGYGILLEDSDGVAIQGNTSSENRVGIGLIRASHVTLTWNYIAGNSIFGLSFKEGSSGNIVRENWIGPSYIGVWVNGSNINEIIKNLISGNGVYGIRLNSSEGNKIYYNTLLSNRYNGFDDGHNSWDDGACGNYWDDYKVKYPDAVSTSDTCNTWGIPYEVFGGENSDLHPLVAPWVCLKRIWGEPGVKPCSS